MESSTSNASNVYGRKTSRPERRLSRKGAAYLEQIALLGGDGVEAVNVGKLFEIDVAELVAQVVHFSKHMKMIS